MERYRAAHQLESGVCPPPAVAIWYGEQVSPSITLDKRASLARAEVGEDSQPPVQIYPASEADGDHAKFQRSRPEDILATVRAPYDAQHKQLEGLLKRLRRATTTVEASTEDEADRPDPHLATYPTAFGEFSFAELYERSRKYAAFVLRHSYHVPPDEIEDSLQAGAMRLWEGLQQEATGLQEKTLAWVGMKVVYAALHATRGDWKYRQQTQAEAGEGTPSGWGTHSREARQADKRTDIHQAISGVAERILREEKGKRQDHELWALYGLTMLQRGSGEVSHLFGVREQSMGKAYARVRQFLQEALPNYAPTGDTRPYRQHGRQTLPEQDIAAICQSNGSVQEAVLAAVQKRIERLNADTRTQDEVALAGIRQGISSTTQSRQQGIPQWTMQRAYRRVHLMLAAERDPTVRVPRPERRVKSVFTLTEESAAAVQQLALQLLEQPKSYEKLVALHAHIGNLGISTTAKHFNIPTSTLRYYSQQIGKQLQTPTQAAREGGAGPNHPDTLAQGEVTLYAWQSAAD